MSPIKSTRWSSWSPLLLAPQNMENKPGVYIIATQYGLARLNGTDRDGVLTIGESNRLKARVRHFIRCAQGTSESGHSAGWRYRSLNFQEHFPLNKLKVRWCYANSGEDEYILEGELLKAYVQKHFELPPLNYKFNFGTPKSRRS